MKTKSFLPIILLLVLLAAACQPAPAPQAGGGIKVLAVETYLADIAQNVAGERLKVEALLPDGLDPHAFEPVPQDVAKIADSRVLIINGAGIEGWLQRTLDNAGPSARGGGARLVIDASKGLASRTAREGEVTEGGAPAAPGASPAGTSPDPHYWLDPTRVIGYVENIRDGLGQVDPDGRDIYAKNAAAYIAKLKDLDAWIMAQVKQIPPAQRLLVTNHESFGYYADRYGFTIVGTILPGVSTDSSPSAQQMARLADKIKSTGVKAIFLETGNNPQLADQIAHDTGVKVGDELLSHSITPPGGKAPTYIDMMKYNTRTIVDALK
jgi:ABC-type Zn uptake system ZnuABC Zn-binding protein ZnuA